LNRDPPDVCLLNSYDYRHELHHDSYNNGIITKITVAICGEMVGGGTSPRKLLKLEVVGHWKRGTWGGRG
jgi:hypothetical protein